MGMGGYQHSIPNNMGYPPSPMPEGVFASGIQGYGAPDSSFQVGSGGMSYMMGPGVSFGGMMSGNSSSMEISEENNGAPGMTGGSSSTVNYMDYNEIQQFPPDVSLTHVLEIIKMGFDNKKDWKQEFSSINHLRRINKFYPGDMNEVFRIFWPNILSAIDSVKSFIAKNILILLKEVFKNSNGYMIYDEIILGVTRQLLAKCFCEKSFLKAEAMEAIDALVINCLYDSTILAMCKCCFDKNAQICELSGKLLAKILENMCEHLKKLKETTIQDLFITLGRLFDGKRHLLHCLSKEICIFLCKLIGYDAYLNCLKTLVSNGSLQEVEGMNCLKALEHKQRRESNVKEFKKQMKKKLSVAKGSYDVDTILAGEPPKHVFMTPSKMGAFNELSMMGSNSSYLMSSGMMNSAQGAWGVANQQRPMGSCGNMMGTSNGWGNNGIGMGVSGTSQIGGSNGITQENMLGGVNGGIYGRNQF